MRFHRGNIAPIFAFALFAGCVLNQGLPPPERQFHNPVAAVTSPDGRFLYVVNSDFNLEYNAGSISVVQLDPVRAAINAGTITPPMPEAGLVVQSKRIRPFATGIAFAADGRRLYVPVRGDGSVTWFDVDPATGMLSCEADPGDPEICSARHSAGRFPVGDARMTAQPVAVSVAPGRNSGESYLVVSHLEAPSSRASLLFEQRSCANSGPQFSHWIGGLSSRLSGLALVPGPTPPEGPRWLAFSRDEPTVHYLRVFDEAARGGSTTCEPENSQQRRFLYAAQPIRLTGLITDVGLRSLVFDPCDPTIAYASTRPSPVASTSVRSGEQLFTIDVRDPEQPRVTRVMSVPQGASQLLAVSPDRCAGTAHTRLYAVLFDSRKVYVVDAAEWREIDQFRTQAGPSSIFADPGYGMGNGRDLLYVVDFTAMCVEVVDGNPRSSSPHRVLYTIGDVVLPPVMQ